jgi:uncharacterized protein (DUF342 family)
MLNNTGSSFLNRANDGVYELEYREDGVYLKVDPPIAKGKRIETREIVERLNKKRVRNYRIDVIEAACLKANRVPVCIAEPQEEVKLDAQVSVTISPDKMKASIVISPPDGGRTINTQDVMEALNANGVVYGINKSNIENITQYPIYNESVLIAEGTPSINGQNGKVKFHFDLKKDRKFTELEDGRVDFYNLNIIESVEKGSVLCSLVPPLPGVPGKTVDGSEIPAQEGKLATLPKGKNVEITEDGQQLIASIDGQVNYIDGKVSVYQIYEIPANVDTSTGNVKFIGNVIVRGNVLSGFTIEAGGTVEVYGVVEAETIIAGGDIILRRGMQGVGKGLLVSGGDVVAKYIENSIIEARLDIKAEAIMHSTVKCGNKLELSGKKGLLIGGIARVGKEVSAKVIGSYMATVTEIEVGVDPSLKERYKKAREELIVLEEDTKKAEQAITILKKLEAVGNLSPDKQEMLAKSVRTKMFYTNKINDIKQELIGIEQRLQYEAQGIIKAYNFIYPGTKVSIGTITMLVKENLQYCTLYREGADIKIGAISS